MGRSTGAKATRRPLRAKDNGDPARTPAQSEARTRKLAAVPEAYDVVDAVVRGRSIASIAKESGLSEATVRQRIRVFRMMAPDAYQQMADGVREFLANIAFEDILHWRPISRDDPDTEKMKIAGARYQSAQDVLIKIFGLATQNLQIGGNRQAPPTMEELASRVAANPDMAAALAQLQRAVDEQKT